MKKSVFLFIAVAWLLAAGCTGNNPDARIQRLLREMTLEEKIGQLSQIVSGEITGPLEGTFSTDEAVKNGWCGSILGLRNPAEIERLQHLAVDSSRLGIPIIFGHDIIHGCRTIFPENIGISCTWDMDAVEKFARVSALEASAFGVAWTFSPMCDVCADARWGRVSEGSGEDTFLSAGIAEAMVRGYQGEDLGADTTILACVKHFAAYGAPEAGRDYNTVDMSWPMFRDKYLPVYKAAIDAGAGSVMSSFNDFEGIPATANRKLLRDELRDSLGFGGFVVSDWNAVKELVNHGVAATEKEAALLAFKAGLNMDMVDGFYLRNLGALVREGRISEKELDAAVKPVLEAKFRLGLFDDPFKYGGKPERMYLPKSLETAREVARKSMVLLSNKNGVLPLSKGTRIALIGPYANNKEEMVGSWKGMAEPERCVTFLEGLSEKFPGILYSKGCEPRSEIPGGTAEAVSMARRSDVVLLTLGLPSSESGEAASLASISLPECQKKLLRAVSATGKPVVILLVTGRPMELCEENDLASAILVTWHPGTMAGHALADLICGEFSPSGRLSMSFPASVGQLPLRYNQKRTGRPKISDSSSAKYVSRYADAPNRPLFEFGSGLSYTSFVYSNLRIQNPVVGPGEDIKVLVDVTNSGIAGAEETVQVYVSDKVASRTRPERELKAFRKVFLRGGETRTVELTVEYPHLAFYSARGRWEVEEGEFTVFAGHSCTADLSDTFTVLSGVQGH